MKKNIIALNLFTLIILSGCTLLTPTEKLTPSITSAKKEPVKVIHDKKEHLLLNIDVKYLLSLTTSEQVSEYVKVKDRNGNQITHLPVKNGQIAVYMDFTPSLLELRYKEDDVPVSLVVYHVCSILKKDVISSDTQSSFKKFNSVDELLIDEICWNDSNYSWEFKFKSKTKNKKGFASSK